MDPAKPVGNELLYDLGWRKVVKARSTTNSAIKLTFQS